MAPTNHDIRPISTPNEPPVWQSLRRRILAGGCWAAGGRILGIALALAVNVLLARTLPASDFGRFALAVSIITFCSIPARFGLDRVSLRMIAHHRGAGRHDQAAAIIRQTYRLALITSPAVAVGTAFILWFARSGLGAAASPPSLWPLFVVGIVLHALLQITAEILRAFDRIDLATLMDGQLAGPLLNLVLLGLTGASAWQRGLSLELAVGLYCLSLAVVLAGSVLALWTVTGRQPASPSPSRTETTDAEAETRLAGMCLSITASAMLSFACYQADLWIAALFCSPHDVGQFAAARRLVQLTALPLATMNLAIIASIPRLYFARRIEELQSTLQLAATIATALAVPVAMGMMLLPHQMLDWAFGPAYQAAAPVLVILIAGQLVFCWTGPCTHSLILTGHHTSALAVHIVTTVLLGILGPIAALQWGIVGLAAASATVVAVNNLGMLLLTRLQTGVWTNASLSLLIGRQGRTQVAQPA